MEDFGLSSLWDGLKKAMGGAADLVWSGIKKLASATVSMLAGVPGFIVNNAVKFIIWCAFNPITSILGYQGLSNPAAASVLTNFAASGLVGAAKIGWVAANAPEMLKRGAEGYAAAKEKLTPSNLSKTIGSGPEFKPGDLPLKPPPPVDKSTQIDYDDIEQGRDILSKLSPAERAKLYDPNNIPTIAQQADSVAKNAVPHEGEIWDNIVAATETIQGWVKDKITPDAIKSIADFAVNWAIPIVAVAAIIYGGQLLYEYITTKEPPKITESKVAKMIKSSLAKHKAAGDTLGGGLVTGPKKLRRHLNRNTVGAQAVPTAESMRAIINKLS